MTFPEYLLHCSLKKVLILISPQSSILQIEECVSGGSYEGILRKSHRSELLLLSINENARP